MNDPGSVRYTRQRVDSHESLPRRSPPAPQYYIKLASPIFARSLLVINLAVFVAMIAYGWLYYQTWRGPETSVVLIDFGMKVNQSVAEGEVWRLFTAMFLHIGVMHLLFNLYALYWFGPMVEGYFGHWRFLAIYMIGGLFGSVASYAYVQAPSAGASGAIFGLIGASTVYFLRYRENFGQRGRLMLQNMIGVIAVNLVFGFAVPGIDNASHLGGLLGGALVAWGMLPNYQRPSLASPSNEQNPSVVPQPMIYRKPQPLIEQDQFIWYVAWLLISIVLLWASLQYANGITDY
ncbi:rhomboid family intramembrane serine protease [Chloroflexi bacterium TSY]|nr:rhomboid family intramembrane serine protease [Chloroflexi bacterium TSY]